MDMLDERIKSALASVFDPCSVAAGRPTSIIDMGLVLDADLDGTTLHIAFCVTFAGCTMAPHFVEAARAELIKLEGVREVVTRIDTDHIWIYPALHPIQGEPQAWRQRINLR